MLYRTAKGRFFVAGEGAALSIWARQVEQNSWAPGKGVRAITDEQARGYMEAAGCPVETFIEVGFAIEEA